MSGSESNIDAGDAGGVGGNYPEAAAVAAGDDNDIEATAIGEVGRVGQSNVGQRNNSRRRRSLIIIAIVLLTIIGGIIGLSVGLTANKDNNNNSSSAEAAQGKDTHANDAPNANTADTDTPSPTPSTSTSSMMGSYYPTSIGGEEEESAGSMYQDDGTCTSNNSSISIVLAGMNNIASSSSSSSSSSCAYITNQTIYIMAPSTSTNNENGTVVVEKKLSGGNSAYFGDTAIIVSYNSDGTAGAVWVLDYSNTNNNNGTTTTTTTSQQQQGSWEQTGILQTEYEDQLGWSVAIKGNSTFVVGAPGYQGMEVPLPSDGWFWSGRGNAIVMTKIDDDDNGGGATSWVRQDELVPISANDTAGFGNSVDIAECECLIAVGAWHDRDSRGSAYVFEKTTNGTWIELQKLAFNDTRRSQSGTLHGNYGYNVAISDEYLAVKAPYDSYIGSYDYEDVNRGVTYVYQRRGSDDGLYEQISRLCTPEGKQVGGVFRDMIFLDDFLLVGAPGKNTVYVFKQLDDTSGFVKTAELKLNDEDITDESSFGIRLDGKGNHVMVGDLGGKMSYIFAYEDGIWKQKSYIDSVDTASSGTSIVTYSPESFVVDGEQYGGEVTFNQLVCDER